MKAKPRIAIAGATGLIGSEIVTLFPAFGLPYTSLALFATKESAGEVYRVGDEEIAVALLDDDALTHADLVFLALPAEVTARYAEIARGAGAVVIDTSYLYRLNSEVPLIAAGVNEQTLSPSNSLIATPTGPVVALCTVLKQLQTVAPIKRVVVTTLQSCAGAGKAGLDELWEQSLAVFNQKEMSHEAFEHQIAFNLIPQIDLLQEDGNSREEVRIVQETRRILGLPSLPVSATAIRVPVFHSDSQSVNIEFAEQVQLPDILKALSGSASITLSAAPDEFPLPVDVAGSDEVHVARIRRDESVVSGINLWIVADSLLRGTALSALHAAKYLVEQCSGSPSV